MMFKVLRAYRLRWLADDGRAALFATLLLIPQALAYATLAGLPPHIGLYASLLPLLLYPLFGSSPVLSVGPVAILGLMTASALAPLALDSNQYIQAAALLALLSGVFLFLFGLLRLGALAHLLSYPVISGFISASALLIMIGQLRPLLGIEANADNSLLLLLAIIRQLPQADTLNLIIGGGSLVILLIARLWLPGCLQAAGFSEQRASLLARSLPVLLIVLGTIATALFWQDSLAVVGSIPQGLPLFSLPNSAFVHLQALVLPALLIALVGFVESIAIARILASRQQQTIHPDKELLGLGAANIGSALSGGMPVTGSFARTVVNVESGARTPMAGLLAAALVAAVLLWGSTLFTWLPLSVLAASIIVAVAGLIDTQALRKAWQQDRSDALALLGTFSAVLLWGVEHGIMIGIGLSLATVIWRASHPSVAVTGRIPGSSHYRNAQNYQVETTPDILIIRIDENLFFGNADVIARSIRQQWQQRPQTRHLILVMSSVSHIDSTALHMLEALNHDLQQQGVSLHLAELKAFVLKPLQRGQFLQQLSGQVFLTTFEAEQSLHNNATQQHGS